MSKGRCICCGQEIPARHIEGSPEEAAHCMHVDTLEWHPSQYARKTVYHKLWICHQCAGQIVNNIAVNDSDVGVE